MRYLVTFGHTLSQHPEYVPSCDGFRPGAAQDSYGFDVDVEASTGDLEVDARRIAEAYFVATNAPRESWGALEHRIEAALAGLRRDGVTTWVMSMGDTMVVAPASPSAGLRGSVLLECARIGFDSRPVTDLVA